MKHIEKLAKKLENRGIVFDTFQRTKAAPSWMRGHDKANFVVRLSSKRTVKHWSFGTYDYVQEIQKLEQALKEIKSIQIIGTTHKEYYGRSGYWGARKSWVPASVDHWTISIYIYWKGK